MNWEQAAEKILKTMLGHLGFEVDVEQELTEDGLCLQIVSDEKRHVIGRNGDRLEDLQYLVNRVLNKHFPKAPRVKVDCDHYRLKQENRLVEKALEIAERVKTEQRDIRTRPLNAYYRRIVHNALANVSGVKTESPGGDARFKRVRVSLSE